MLEAALVVAAAVAGATGAWSPCGFSMVETLGPTGHDGGRRGTLAACATFALGALAGGAATFALLGAVGALVQGGAGGDAARTLALAVALAAAVGEARGARVLPQVRRQVPEGWRRTLPLPLAAALYGVLLGIGFTTFVLTLAVWALAGLVVLAGDPALGALVGLAFGAGRAAPVAILAPLAGSEAGARATDAMALRPGILRAFRAADGVALAACAAVLGASPAAAAELVAAGATDPSAAGDDLAWHRPGAAGVLVRGPQAALLPGTDPAIGGPYLAWREGERLVVARRDTGETVTSVGAPGADKLAVSERWLAYRIRRADGGDSLVVQAVLGGEVRGVASVTSPARIGRPALDGDLLAYDVAGRSRSRITQLDLSTGERTELVGGPGVALAHPALRDRALLYVRTSSRTQQLRLRVPGAPERALYEIAASARRDRGHERRRRPHRRAPRLGRQPPRAPRGVTRTLWTAALSDRFAYVTRLTQRRGRRTSTIVRVPR